MENNQVLNPYADTPATLQKTSVTDVEASRAVAEVQAAALLAKRFPRSPQQCMDRILNECQRVSLAEQALYSYSRGGQEITGPSIRLAEVIARNWGNMDFGIKELSQRNGESEVMAYAWDLESNVRELKVFTVKHVRNTKRGSYAIEDSRDIYELTANQGSRRLRACILGIIPGDVIDAAKTQCEETLNAKADTSPAAVKKMADAFAEYGITKEMIEKRIQRRMDTITPAQIISLRKIYTSIRDDISVPSDWFEIHTESAAQKTGTDALKAALSKEPKKEAGQPNEPEKATDIPEEAPPWNPETEDFPAKYTGTHTAAIKSKAAELRIDITGMKPRQAHEAIKAHIKDHPSVDVDIQERFNDLWVNASKMAKEYADMTLMLAGAKPSPEHYAEWNQIVEEYQKGVEQG